MQHVSSKYLKEVDEEFELFKSFGLVTGAEKHLRERRNAEEHVERWEWTERDMAFEIEDDLQILFSNKCYHQEYRKNLIGIRTLCQSLLSRNLIVYTDLDLMGP